MSEPHAHARSRIRLRESDEEQEQQQQQPTDSTKAQSASSADNSRSDSAAIPISSTQTAAAAPGVQPLPEQMRKRPRLSSQIGHLAVIELQLVLQWLDPRSRLVAARCSRRLLQAADHPFAWSAAKPFPIDSRVHAHPGSVIRRSLLRHAAITLTLVNADLPLSEVALLPRLHGLKAWVDLPFRLLTLPVLQGLQTLALSRGTSASDLQRLPSLPQLHTLEFCTWLSDDDYSWLPAIPALTDLDIFLYSSLSPIHEAIGQCTRLQSLRLGNLHCESDIFARFCKTPAMRRLRRLDFQHLFVGPPLLSANDWRAGFGALAQLESLRLEEVEGIDLLLPHLAHAPALRALTLRLCASGDPQPTTHPSAAVLCALLSAAPQLEVRLHMAATLARWRASRPYQRERKSAHASERMDQQWRELQRMATELDRVTSADWTPT